MVNPFAITLAEGEDPSLYVVGPAMVGCTNHDEIVWSPDREGWSCPACGYQPPATEETLTVLDVDHDTGTVTIG